MADGKENKSDEFVPNEKTDKIFFDLLRSFFPKAISAIREVLVKERRTYLTNYIHQLNAKGVTDIEVAKCADRGEVFSLTDERIAEVRVTGEFLRKLAKFFKDLEPLFSGPSWQDTRKAQLEHAAGVRRSEHHEFDAAGNIVHSDDD